MMLACCLVNRTQWETAEPAFLRIRRRFPTPALLARARPRQLHAVLRPLGLWRARAARLPSMAKAWVICPPTTYTDILKLPGCGLYASQSWAIFIEGRLLDSSTVTDHKLEWFLLEVAAGRAAIPTEPAK